MRVDTLLQIGDLTTFNGYVAVRLLFRRDAVARFRADSGTPEARK